MPPLPLAGAEAVNFDDPAADALANDLDDLADALRALARATAGDSESARRDWSGFTRTWFEGHLAQVLGGLRRSRAQVEEAAAHVRQAKVAAATLQDQRNAQALRQRRLDIERYAAAVAAQQSAN